jgi:hypothetical protein
MPRVIEFNIPTHTGIQQARGVPIYLNVGTRRIKFILQRDSEGKAKWLTHYASGYRFGALDDVHVELMCKLSPYHRFTQKQLAEFLIDKQVTRLGVEKVLASIDGAAVINGKKKIVTTFIYPPIPIRRFDWLAMFEGDDGDSPRKGYGTTEQEAIADLLEVTNGQDNS